MSYIGDIEYILHTPHLMPKACLYGGGEDGILILPTMKGTYVALYFTKKRKKHC